MIYIIDSVLEGKDYIENLSKEQNYKYNMDFILRNGTRIPLTMYIDKDRFPFQLPIVYINKSKQEYIPNIPHITSDGYICYLDKEGVVWSDDNEKVFDFVFQRIELILLRNESIEGIHREFQHYFVQVPKLEFMFSYISDGNSTRKIKIVMDASSKVKILFDNTEIDRNIYKKVQMVNAIYIPFEKCLDIYIPNKSKFWTSNEIYGLLNRCVSEKNIKKSKEFNKR